MKGNLFAHEVTKTSTVFGRKHDTTVVFAGDQAATDGSTIFLPSIDQNADVTDEQAAIMRGYVDHEAGHIRHSNMNAIKRLYKECEASGNVLLRSLHNALEDIWLERRVRDEYAGAAHNLRATTTAVNNEFLRNADEIGERVKDDQFIAPVALTWEGRKDYGGDTCGQCLDLLAPDLRRQLPVWIGALDACRNSRDVIALARTIEKELHDGDYKDEEHRGSRAPEERSRGGDTGGSGRGAGKGDVKPDGEGTGEHGRESGQPDGDGDSRGDGRGAGESGGDTGGKHGNESGGKGDTTVAGECDTLPEGVDVYTQFDVGECIEHELRSGGLLGGSDGAYRPLTTAHDKWHHRLDPPRKYGKATFGQYLASGSASEYDDQVRGMAGEVNIMRRKLERALMAKQQRDWDYAKEHGRLDSRRFTSAFNGRENVFKMRSDSTEMDTALTILIDLSGSMIGKEAYVAMQCAIAMCESIDRTGIAYEVLGFNNRSDWTPGVKRPHRGHKRAREGGVFTRYEPLDMYIFKAFEERMFEAKGAMSRINQMAGGNNSDGEALGYAYQRLRKRPESRKVFITLSDGMPACRTTDPDALYQHLRDAVQDMTDDGVDCIGIGILSDAVQRFYPKYTVINSIEELASTGMDNLARALMGERFVVDNTKLMDAKKSA